MVSPRLRRIRRLFFNHLYHGLAWSYDFVAAVVSLGHWNRGLKLPYRSLRGPRVLELGHGPGHLQTRLSMDETIVAVGLDEVPTNGKNCAAPNSHAGALRPRVLSAAELSDCLSSPARLTQSLPRFRRNSSLKSPQPQRQCVCYPRPEVSSSCPWPGSPLDGLWPGLRPGCSMLPAKHRRIGGISSRGSLGSHCGAPGFTSTFTRSGNRIQHCPDSCRHKANWYQREAWGFARIGDRQRLREASPKPPPDPRYFGTHSSCCPARGYRGRRDLPRPSSLAPLLAESAGGP